MFIIARDGLKLARKLRLVFLARLTAIGILLHQFFLILHSPRCSASSGNYLFLFHCNLSLYNPVNNIDNISNHFLFSKYIFTWPPTMLAYVEPFNNALSI
jgi:hypothetical protein